MQRHPWLSGDVVVVDPVRGRRGVRISPSGGDEVADVGQLGSSVAADRGEHRPLVGAGEVHGVGGIHRHLRAVSDFTWSDVSVTVAAAQFSSTWATALVPGIGSMTGE